MKKIFSAVFLSLLAFIFVPSPVLAHCPLCVAGAAVGLSLSRWIGVDDSITGLWLAALLGAISFWSYGAIARKLKIKYVALLKSVIYIAVFAATIWSFYKFNLVVRMGTIYGIDKLTFGMVAGGAAFYIIDIVNNLVYKTAGKSLFPYQRIVFSLGTILILSIADYVLISYYL